MNLSQEEGREIVWGDNKDWETIETKISGTSRWAIEHQGIFLHKPSGKHYSICWRTGSTEQQEEGPFEYDNPEPIEVNPVKKIVTVWEEVQKNQTD